MTLKSLTKNLFLYTLIDVYEDINYGRTYIGQTSTGSIGNGLDHFDLRFPERNVIINCLDKRIIKDWWIVKENHIAVVLRKEDK